MEEVGKYLRKCREKAGATQKEVSKYLGYNSPQYISNVERGVCGPAVDKVDAWCECVGASKKLVLRLMVKTYGKNVESHLIL